MAVQSDLRLRPPLLSDQFSKYQKFPSQITTFGTSCKRPRPVLELKD